MCEQTRTATKKNPRLGSQTCKRASERTRERRRAGIPKRNVRPALAFARSHGSAFSNYCAAEPLNARGQKKHQAPEGRPRRRCLRQRAHTADERARHRRRGPAELSVTTSTRQTTALRKTSSAQGSTGNWSLRVPRARGSPRAGLAGGCEACWSAPSPRRSAVTSSWST